MIERPLIRIGILFVVGGIDMIVFNLILIQIELNQPYENPPSGGTHMLHVETFWTAYGIVGIGSLAIGLFLMAVDLIAFQRIFSESMT